MASECLLYLSVQFGFHVFIFCRLQHDNANSTHQVKTNPPIYTQVKINFPGPSPIKILFWASFVAACGLQQTVNFWVSYTHRFIPIPSCIITVLIGLHISGAVLRLHRIMVAPPNNKLPIIIIDNPIHFRIAEIKEALCSIFCSEL